MIELILPSTRRVCAMTQCVTIDADAMKRYAGMLAERKVTPAKHWILDDAYFSPRILALDLERQLLFFFLFNLLSFSYWGKPKWAIQTDQGMLDGSFAMSYVLLNAIDSGYGTVESWKEISFQDFESMMHSPVAVIPLIEMRFDMIRSTFRIIADRKRSFLSLLRDAGGDVSNFVDELHDAFPAFHDESPYKGERVYFLKKAQLFAADCFYVMKGHESGLANIDALTACADYKLPQLLESFGILKYEQSLLEKIQKRELFEPDSPEEVAIRAATIVAVDDILLLLNEYLPVPLNGMELNNMLWISSQDIQRDMHPYHLVRTVKY